VDFCAAFGDMKYLSTHASTHGASPLPRERRRTPEVCEGGELCRQTGLRNPTRALRGSPFLLLPLCPHRAFLVAYSRSHASSFLSSSCDRCQESALREHESQLAQSDAALDEAATSNAAIKARHLPLFA